MAEQWLDREDKSCREDRLARLEWLAGRVPTAEYLTFPGGWLSKYLFEETRYCFVYGQFIACTVLGCAFTDHSLAAILYAAGRDDLERANISVLLREALSCGLITEAEYEDIDRVRGLRNPIAHFRKPLHDDTIEYRAVAFQELPYSILEEDARHVMQAVLHLVGKNAV